MNILCSFLYNNHHHRPRMQSSLIAEFNQLRSIHFFSWYYSSSRNTKFIVKRIHQSRFENVLSGRTGYLKFYANWESLFQVSLCGNQFISFGASFMTHALDATTLNSEIPQISKCTSQDHNIEQGGSMHTDLPHREFNWERWKWNLWSTTASAD